MRAASLLLCLAASSFAADVPHFGDATLRAVQFVDENEGWAAGDDGVVWHTIDSGKTWERQSTGVRASLRSIQFITPYAGWIAGRIELPGGGSSGVVLGTTDGGLKWRVLSSNSVPGLNAIKFFGDRDGIAAGDGSEAFPSGLFATVDGGRTWKAIPGLRNPTWLAADFSDPETGVVAGAWNRIAPVRDRTLGVADVDSLGGRNVTGLKLNGDRAVAVGQGGLVMVSSDTAGVRWGFPDLKLPKELRAAIDFHAVAVHKSHVWAIGRPGSIVFHSADHGTTWESFKTGQPLPLHAVNFLDEQRGWAVGELGTILNSTDGGRTWTVQRQGGMRSAALFVHANAKDAPLDTIAALGGEDGYLTVGLSVTCPDPATLARRYETYAERLAAAMKAADPLRASDPARLAQALRLTGGAVGEALWQFPVAGFQDAQDASTLLDAWEKKHGEKASGTMLRQLVLALRIWRPDVVIADRPTDETARTVTTVLRRAFEVAADPTAFPEQIETLGLAPWAGRKLFVGLDKVDPTAIKADVIGPLPRLGESAREHAAAGFRLWDAPASTPGYRLIATRLTDTAGQTGFFDGISLAPGGAARRELPVLTEKDEAYRAELLKAHEKKRNVQAIIDGVAGPLAGPDQALAHLGEAVKDLPAMDAGKALYTAASSYAAGGRWGFAREAYLLLLEKYPGHPLAIDAARWLVRLQSSSEARRRYELGQFVATTDLSFDLVDRQLPKRLIESKENSKAILTPPKGTEVIQAGHRAVPDAVMNARQWYLQAVALESRFAAYGDLFAQDVPTNLCLAAARRQLGRAEDSRDWFLRYIGETAIPAGAPTPARGADPWRECVLLESWLLNQAGQGAPKPVAACKKAATRPHLDGKLDDACWADAVPLHLTTMAGELGAEFGCKEAIEHAFREKGKSAGLKEAVAEGTRAAFAFDDEYLYVAVVCRHPAGMRKDKLEKRSHDMDLRSHDRVSLLIDLDRDYQTYYQLQIDQRGAVADDCWGDKTWNPKWFVAVNPDETGWTAEVAIPLSELTGDTITAGKLWAINVVRMVPGKGVQAWSGPAGVTPRPEGMGLLTFVGER